MDKNNSNQKLYITLSHIGTLINFAVPSLGFIAPLIILIASEDTLVRKHAKESLNFQITLIICTFVVALLTFAGIFTFFSLGFFSIIGGSGLGLIGILSIFLTLITIVLPVIATIKASEHPENVWKYPFTLRLVS